MFFLCYSPLALACWQIALGMGRNYLGFRYNYNGGCILHQPLPQTRLDSPKHDKARTRERAARPMKKISLLELSARSCAAFFHPSNLVTTIEGAFCFAVTTQLPSPFAPTTTTPGQEESSHVPVAYNIDNVLAVSTGGRGARGPRSALCPVHLAFWQGKEYGLLLSTRPAWG